MFLNKNFQMFKKLEELKQDVTSVAQRGVQTFQELINAPFTAIELSGKEIEIFVATNAVSFQ